MFLLDLSGYRSFSSDMAGDSSGRKGTDRSPARLIDRMAVAPFEAAIAMARSRTAVQGRLRKFEVTRGRLRRTTLNFSNISGLSIELLEGHSSVGSAQTSDPHSKAMLVK
jgi:hypothetical protein